MAKCLAVLSLFLVIAFSPMIDIAVSQWFYDGDKFYLKNSWLLEILHQGIPEFLIGVAMFIFGIWALGILNKHKFIWGINTRVMLLTTASMFLGPILVVNGVFKSFWGRARPENIVYFGGDKLFTPPMVISNQCDWDCSFMSGHTSIGFWTISLALLVPAKYRKLALLIALFFGILSGLARIAQGMHFFSDVFFAAVFTMAIVFGIHKKLFDEEYDKV